MNSKQVYNKIKKIDKKYKLIKCELEDNKLLKSDLNNYIKTDKQSFLLLWAKYIDFFSNLQKLIKETKYKSFISWTDYNKLVLRKYLLAYYFNVIVDLEKYFWEHMSFLRIYIEESFKRDFWYFVNYIYRPEFIDLINTPQIFISPFKEFVDEDIYDLLNKSSLDTQYLNRLKVDYKNLFFHLKKWFFKGLFVIARYIWLWLSKIRFTSRKYWLISEENLLEYLSLAKPWDILLTRWNWNATNLSIPGFWKHMSMYIWSWKFLKKNFDYAFLKDLDDKFHYIIEATWEWVNISSINDLVSHNDYLWVSRTRFKKEKVLRAVDNSLKNIWKWYDFIFNFHSDNNLVCSELIMKSYSKEFDTDDGIEISLENMWISLAFPPNNFINILFTLKEDKKPEIYPIFFIDTVEKSWKNFISNSVELLNSWNRSRTTLFLK